MLANDCNNCHADLKSEVAATQAKEEQRVTSISEKIGGYDEQDRQQVR